MKKNILSTLVFATLLMTGCTQETQNKLGRTLQNWTGTNGVLDIYMGNSSSVTKRIIKIDKLTTATATDSDTPRNYRYGYGYLDVNQNMKVDNGEKKIYFEISNFSTPYIFYSNPE